METWDEREGLVAMHQIRGVGWGTLDKLRKGGLGYRQAAGGGRNENVAGSGDQFSHDRPDSGKVDSPLGGTGDRGVEKTGNPGGNPAG